MRKILSMVFIGGISCAVAGWLLMVVGGFVWGPWFEHNRPAFHYVEALIFGGFGICMIAGVIALADLLLERD